jgi:CRISPR-associated endonuclease/helicase Cas3
MIILFVSECEHNAFKLSRRILNKYATQLGRRTWMARLSEEGLRHIRSELKSKVTRQMSVSCHRIRGNNRTTLEWIIGTRKHFNTEGAYAFSWTKRDMLQTVIEPTPMERAARYLTELAGLFHDFGKATQTFQNKLQKNSKEGDPLRHEYVSWLMLERLLGQPANDAAWLEQLADRSGWLTLLQACFTDGCYTTPERLKTLWAIVKNEESPTGTLFASSKAQQHLANTTPLLFALAWLVMSHHKLPAVQDFFGKNIILGIGNQAHNKQLLPAFHACIQPAAGKQAIWMENTWWTEQINAKAKQLLNLLREHPDITREQDAWLAFLGSYCRTMLMLGDHFVSSENNKQCFTCDDNKKRKKEKEDRSNELYFANTNTTAPRNKNKPAPLAATLNEHLRGVGRESGSLFRLGLRLMDTLPGIAPERLPDGLRQIGKDKTSAYYWQDDACQRIQKRISDGIQDRGFFGIVIARTGAGKTRACARIMAQLSNRVRYNLALGLRTLTLQSGTAYREELGLDKTQVSTLVGSEVARRLHEINQAAVGSESASAEDMEMYAVDGEWDVDQELPPQLEKLLEKEPKKRQLITTPILVSTVDYLVSAANPNRSRHLYATLRLMTSDLVLDEVDSYGEEDLIVLGKLVYLCGLFGRKVLLASATLPPAIAEHFYAAYAKGYQHYCTRKQKPSCIFAGWFADNPALSCVEKCNDTTAFNLTHEKITGRVIAQLTAETAKRRAVFLALPSAEKRMDNDGKIIYTLGNTFQAVFGQCATFHHQHKIHDPQTGKFISIGLVRWANTAACWQFAEYLLKQSPPTGIDHRVLCYHAKLLPVVRFEVETHLDKMLKRKDETNFLQHDLIRNVLDNSAEQDVMLVVSATPIEEIGRDHDFDWAIIEPSSTRAIIQTAGRVRRHRGVSGNTANIAILSHTIRALKGVALAFRYPGVESNAYPLGEKEAAKVYDFALLEQSIDARLLLSEGQTEKSRITQLEHKKLRGWLQGETEGKERDGKMLGLNDFLHNPLLAMADHHAKHNRFRRSGLKLLFWQSDDEGSWMRQWENDKDDNGNGDKEPTPSKDLVTQANLDCKRHLLVNTKSVHDLYKELRAKIYPENAHETITRQQLLGIEIDTYGQDDNAPNLVFHPLLGAYREP